MHLEPFGDDKATMARQPDMDDFRFYRYDPSVAANAVFVGLFGLVTAGHIFALVKRRTWYFIPFVIGGLCKCTP